MTIKSTVKAALAEVKDWSIPTLAGSDLADTYCPDRQSDGARFLDHVRNATVELIESNFYPDTDGVEWFDSVNDDGSVSDIADGAPDIYTSTRWREFVELGAYTEDPTELGFDGTDMEKGAGICLYIIAERLANAILQYVREAVENAEDEGQEDD